jgi:hypothetical protein
VRTVLWVVASMAVVLSACANPYKRAVEFTWENRESVVWGHEGLTVEQRVNLIYMYGAAMDVEPDELDAEVEGRMSRLERGSNETH